MSGRFFVVIVGRIMMNADAAMKAKERKVKIIICKA